MEKIKVIRIIARLNIGGPAIHTVLLSEGLDKARFDSLLVAGSISRDEGDMLYYADGKKIKPRFIAELRRQLSPLADIIALIRIYCLIKREKPDIIHTHTAKAGTLGRLSGIIYHFFHRRKRVYLVHTFHGAYFSGYFRGPVTMSFVVIERLLAAFTDKVVTLSESLKNDLVRHRITYREKIAVIPLGFELEEYLRIPARPKKEASSIGIIGRLVAIKNHRLFLEAAARLVSENPELRLKFQIIGDGELRKNLEEYTCRLGLKDKADFLGWQKGLADIYDKLDIVALTSRNEGTPVSLVEAMASARPVVATDVGGVRDLLGEPLPGYPQQKENFLILERGVAVGPDDPQGFALALAFMLRNEDLRSRLICSARNFVKAQFNKQRLVKDTQDLYFDLCHKKTGV